MVTIEIDPHCFVLPFCRIISTCGELLRQSGAFELQLSNKYDYLFSFHNSGFTLQIFGVLDQFVFWC